MKTRITEILGIEYPILQGGMAWVAEHNLAAAVSEAGGLGIIGAGGAPAEFVREQIQKVKEVTDKPFGVNIMLMNPEADAIAQVVVDEGVKVVTTGAGNPSKYMEMWKAAGEGHTCCGECRDGEADAARRRGCCCRRGHGERRTYWVDHDNGACAADRRCSGDSCRGGGRHRRWQRICSSLYARRGGSADRHALCRGDGIYRTREV